jgi:dihydrofolate reductase
VTVISDDPIAAVRSLKRRDGRNIWLCGGAKLAATLVDEIDELVLKINPVILGSGIPLFRRDELPVDVELVDARTFDGGVAIYRYRLITDPADVEASRATEIHV